MHALPYSTQTFIASINSGHNPGAPEKQINEVFEKLSQVPIKLTINKTNPHNTIIKKICNNCSFYYN